MALTPLSQAMGDFRKIHLHRRNIPWQKRRASRWKWSKRRHDVHPG